MRYKFEVQNYTQKKLFGKPVIQVYTTIITSKSEHEARRKIIEKHLNFGEFVHLLVKISESKVK